MSQICLNGNAQRATEIIRQEVNGVIVSPKNSHLDRVIVFVLTSLLRNADGCYLTTISSANTYNTQFEEKWDTRDIYYSWVTDVPRQYHRTIYISFRYLIKSKAKKTETIVTLAGSWLLAPTYCNFYKLQLSRTASNLAIQMSLSSEESGNRIDHLTTDHPAVIGVLTKD